MRVEVTVVFRYFYGVHSLCVVGVFISVIDYFTVYITYFIKNKFRFQKHVTSPLPLIFHQLLLVTINVLAC